MSESSTEPWCSSMNMAAEAVFFLFKTGEALLEPTARLYIAGGVCMQQFYNDTDVCDNLSNHPDHENAVQALAASYLAYYKLVLNLPALLIATFCGAWSDRVGRKLPIIMSSFGTIVAVVFYLISLLVMTYSPWVFIVFVFIGAAVRGAFGKSTVMTMAVHSYVADISSKSSRTQKLSKLLSMNYFGYFFGSLLTGALLQLTDFAYVFTAVIIVNSICVFITIYTMRESVPLDAIYKASNEALNNDEGNASKQANWKSRIPFRWKNVRESLQVITKPRVNHSRTHILFFFALIFIQQACKSGEVDITVLYTAKTPLNWPESTYGYLLAVDYACLGISSAIVLPCLVRFFGLTDMTLCIIGISFKIIRLAMIAYGRYTWLVFLSVVIGSPSALIISSAKSMISKSVGEDEMGKTFSLLSCGETIANLVGSLTFTGLYAATVNIYPGLTFAADAGLMVILLFTILLLTYDIRRTNRNLSVTSPYASLEDSNLNGNNLLIGSAAQLTSDDVCSSYGAVEQTNNGGHFTDVNNPVGDTCTEDKLKKQLTSSDDESRHNAGNT